MCVGNAFELRDFVGRGFEMHDYYFIITIIIIIIIISLLISVS